MIDVKLQKTHTHAGTEHPAGSTITVPDDTADYLEQHGIGSRIKQTFGASVRRGKAVSDPEPETSNIEEEPSNER